MRKILVYLLFIICIINCGGTDSDSVYKIQKGDFSSSITETGELKAVNSTAIMMPGVQGLEGKYKVTYLEEEGKVVKKGDRVAEIDNSSIVQVIENKKADLLISESDMEKLRVENETRIKNLQADLRSSEAALRSAKIDLQKVQYESETTKKIRSLNLRKAEIAYDKTLKKIETTKIVHDEQVKIQQIKMDQIDEDIKAYTAALDEFTLRAPKNGMIEYAENWQTDKKIQVGDELYSFWQQVVALPDLSRMKIETTVNELDRKKISIGQKAYVRLDAFPKKRFTGSVIKISNISRKKDRESKIKVFDVVILLDGIDRILKPGMTVSCEFVTAELENVLFVDKSCINEDKEEYYLYIEGSLSDKRIPVKLGPQNNKYIVVYGDIKEGDKVIIQKEAGKI